MVGRLQGGLLPIPGVIVNSTPCLIDPVALAINPPEHEVVTTLYAPNDACTCFGRPLVPNCSQVSTPNLCADLRAIKRLDSSQLESRILPVCAVSSTHRV